MAKSDKFVYIKSATGRPVHLVDIYTPGEDGNSLEIDIDKRMIENKVALKVKRTPFIMSRVATEGDIGIVEESEIKSGEYISSDDFFAQVEKEREEEAKASLENKGKVLKKALNDISQAVSPEVATVTFESTKPKKTTKK